MNKRKVALATIAVALIVLGVLWHPVDVTYRLWRYRSDPDAFNRYLPQLCEKGDDVLPHVYDSFERHGKRSDVAAFRVAVAHTLRCLRSRQAERVGSIVLHHQAYADLPADPKLFDTIVRAFREEPIAERRAEMLTFMWELDFRARFAIFAGIFAGPYPIPYPWDSIPRIDPYGRRLEDKLDLSTIRNEWCRVVAPSVRRALEARTLGERMVRDGSSELATAACEPTDLALVEQLLREGNEDEWRAALDALGNAAEHSVPSARDRVLSVFSSGIPCQRQREVFHWLQRGVDEATATKIAAAAQPCLSESYCDGATRPCADVLVDRLMNR